MILLQRSEGGGLGIGQAGSGGLEITFQLELPQRLTKTTSFLALCFFITSFLWFNLMSIKKNL